MWQHEHRRFADFVSVEQNVDIKRPRCPALAARSAVSHFDLLQLVQKREGRDRSFDQGRTVEVFALFGRSADWASAVPSAMASQLYIRQRFDLDDSRCQRGCAIAKIRAKTKQTRWHRA